MYAIRSYYDNWLSPLTTHPEFPEVMVDINELEATSWLPIVPQEPLIFKLLKAGLAHSINVSSEALQPADTDGNKAHFSPLGNLEEPS